MAPGNKDHAHAPLKVPDWWPGATGNVRFPTDDSLSKAASALRGHLDALDKAMTELQSNGLVTAEDVGNWDAGQALAKTVKAAHEHISAVYQDFQQQLAEAVRVLIMTGQNHSDAEHAATRAVRRLGGGESAKTPSAEPTLQNTRSMD